MTEEQIQKQRQKVSQLKQFVQQKAYFKNELETKLEVKQQAEQNVLAELQAELEEQYMTSNTNNPQFINNICHALSTNFNENSEIVNNNTFGKIKIAREQGNTGAQLQVNSGRERILSHYTGCVTGESDLDSIYLSEINAENFSSNMLRMKSVQIRKLNYQTGTGDEGGITNHEESCTDDNFDFKSIIFGLGKPQSTSQHTYQNYNGDQTSHQTSNIDINESNSIIQFVQQDNKQEKITETQEFITEQNLETSQPHQITQRQSLTMDQNDQDNIPLHEIAERRESSHNSEDGSLKLKQNSESKGDVNFQSTQLSKCNSNRDLVLLQGTFNIKDAAVVSEQSPVELRANDKSLSMKNSKWNIVNKPKPQLSKPAFANDIVRDEFDQEITGTQLQPRFVRRSIANKESKKRKLKGGYLQQQQQQREQVNFLRKCTSNLECENVERRNEGDEICKGVDVCSPCFNQHMQSPEKIEIEK